MGLGLAQEVARTRDHKKFGLMWFMVIPHLLQPTHKQAYDTFQMCHINVLPILPYVVSLSKRDDNHFKKKMCSLKMYWAPMEITTKLTPNSSLSLSHSVNKMVIILRKKCFF